MKYRLMKEYPSSPSLGVIVEEVGGLMMKDINSNFHIHRVFVKEYPEFWEEVKELLFTTTDGKKIKEGDEYFSVVSYYSDWSDFIYPKGLYKMTVEKNVASFHKCMQTSPSFSSKEAAEKYIEENKPQFSLKQVISILKGFDKEINEFEWMNSNETNYLEFIEKYK